MTNIISAILKQMSQKMHHEEEKCAASQKLNPRYPRTPLRIPPRPHPPITRLYLEKSR